jgi:hypothetical protein
MYTHYWVYLPGHPRYIQAWPTILDDTRRIIAQVREAGIVIAGPDGYRRPTLDPADGIGFNGDATSDLDGAPFHLLAPLPAHPHGIPAAGAFCATRRKPYDLAVAAVLLRCRLLLPDVFGIRSDGAWDVEWARGATTGTAAGAAGIGARRLVADLFGEVPDTDPVHSTLLPGGEG